MAVLVILSGKHQGKRLTLPDGEVVIGRDAACQIRLATEEVSRQHCRLKCAGDEVLVFDLGSRNGTLINDVAIPAETLMKPGDTLRIGPIAFQLVGSKKEATGTAKVDSAKKKSASDDSIMDWLADEEAEVKASDTTIIRRDPVPPKKVEPPPALEINSLTPLPPTGKKFKTVGDEGEDIIQRHFELVQSGQMPKRTPPLKPK